VAGVIREKRLEHTRRELAELACAEETVFAIASRWGFVSPSHFSRVFRAAYGQSPSEYREAALARQR
jgi:AraC-like DNA-binding protein